MPEQINEEGSTRILELFEQRRALDLQLIGVARLEVERINGEFKAESLAVLSSLEEMISGDVRNWNDFINLCAVINGYGVVPALPEQSRCQKLLKFLGFDLWTRRAKRN